MLRRTSIGQALGLSVLLFVLPALAQEKSANPSDVTEFPVILQQKVAAGITPTGTKVQAKLTIATLVNGTVIPRDAIFSGQVTESEPKSSSAPSKLSIRMDSVQWRDGSLTMTVYLTEWYYPTKEAMQEDGPRGGPRTHGEIGVTLGGQPNNYPNSPNGPNMPIPGPRSADDGSMTPDPDTVTGGDVSSHRVRMKDVESTLDSDGAITLSSKRNGLKLDKNTTYVLASGTLLAQTNSDTGRTR